MTEYKYEYYSTLKKDRIGISFGLEKSTEYEYYSVWKNHSNTNTSILPQLFE